MRSILEELFYGNICPNTDCRSTDKETKQLMGYIADHHDKLLPHVNVVMEAQLANMLLIDVTLPVFRS